MNIAFADGKSEIAREALLSCAVLSRTVSVLEFGNRRSKFVAMGLLTNLSIASERRKNVILTRALNADGVYTLTTGQCPPWLLPKTWPTWRLGYMMALF